MKATLIQIIFTFAATVLCAETSVVRTGEHANFTRLTVDSVGKKSWTVSDSPRNNSVTIRIEGVQDFEISNALDRIGDQRISNISVERQPISLVLNLACNCSTSASVYRGLLVVDIREEKKDLQGEDTPSVIIRSFGENEEEKYDIKSFVKSGIESVYKIGPPANSLTAFETKLFRKIDELHSLSSPQVALNNVLQLPFSPKTTRNSLQSSEVNTSHLKKDTTQITEEYLRESENSREKYTFEKSCNLGHSLHIRSWTKSNDISDELSRIRRQYASEEKVVSNREMLETLQVYLYFGFGQEALNLFNQLKSPENNLHLLYLASVLEGLRPPARVRGFFLPCEESLQIWSLLEDETYLTEGSLRIYEATSILNSFSDLPEPLRARVGERIVTFLIKRQRVDRDLLSRLLANTNHQYPTITTDNPNFAQSQLQYPKASNKDFVAEPIFTQTLDVQTGDQFSDSNDLANETFEPTVELGLLDAYSIELRGTKFEVDIRIELAARAINGGEYDAALQYIMELENQTVDDSLRLFEKLLSSLLRTRKLGELLKLKYKYPERFLAIKNKTLALDLAENLQAHGFRSSAVELIENHNLADTNRGKTILAQEHLHERRFDIGAKEIANVTGASSSLLKKQFLLHLEKYQEALSFQESSKDNEDHPSIEFLADQVNKRDSEEKTPTSNQSNFENLNKPSQSKLRKAASLIGSAEEFRFSATRNIDALSSLSTNF